MDSLFMHPNTVKHRLHVCSWKLVGDLLPIVADDVCPEAGLYADHTARVALTDEGDAGIYCRAHDALDWGKVVIIR